MSNLTLARRLGRRMNQVLIDQSIFAWTHRILGITAGSICAFSWIATHPYVTSHGVVLWIARYFRLIVAAVFFAAAFPFVISYAANFHWVSQNSVRTVLFVTIVVAIGVIADGVTIVIFRSEVSAFWLILVFLNQASAYIFVGQMILADDDRIYLPIKL
jgi:hypothetical protein